MGDWYEELLLVREYANGCKTKPEGDVQQRILAFQRKKRKWLKRCGTLQITPKECRFVVVPLRPRRELAPQLYETLRLLRATYDLLGLIHLVPVPADHLLRPPTYRKHVPYVPPPVRVVELD